VQTDFWLFNKYLFAPLMQSIEGAKKVLLAQVMVIIMTLFISYYYLLLSRAKFERRVLEILEHRETYA